MVLDYTLELEANITPSVLLAKVARVSGLQETGSGVLKDVSSSFSISAYKETDKWSIDVTKKEYGFIPCSCLSMRHGKGKIEQEQGERIMDSVVIELLRLCSGNVVFEFSQSSTYVLKRIENEIFVNPEGLDTVGIGLLKEAGLQ